MSRPERLTSWGYVSADGVRHVGRDLDAPVNLVWSEELARCSTCKADSHWRTERGRATHPTCDPRGAVDRLNDRALRRLIFDVAAVLPVAGITTTTPAGRRPRVVAYSGQPCDICGSTEGTLLCTLVQKYRDPYQSTRCKAHMMT